MKKLDKIRKLLLPLVRMEEYRADCFLAENMEDLIEIIESLQIEDKVLDFLTAHPNASIQEFYHILPEWISPGEEYFPEDDENVDISDLSEYVQLLLMRYDDKNIEEEESDILYFLIGNPGYIGVEDKALSYLQAHPEATLVEFYEDYIDEIIPKDYRKKLIERMGWQDTEEK